MDLRERLLEKLGQMAERATELERLLGTPEVASDGQRSTKLAQELGQLMKLVQPYRAHQLLARQHQDAQEMMEDDEPELAELAGAECAELEAAMDASVDQLKDLILQADPENDRNVIVEIRAGTGGDEARLFAADLFTLYSRFAEVKRLRVEVLEVSTSELGGYKEVTFSLKGANAYGLMRYESGGHRVQRVPKTESQGRIHTSMATVGVLPEVADVEVHIDPSDLRVDTMRAGGPGGQHVNKTESAVRIVHLPTGIEVKCQEKSQHQNRQQAMRILRARLYEHEKAKRQQERGEMRRNLIGSGDRSERIRTYNFPQNRVTDHRLEFSLYDLEGVLAGNIDELITRLQSRDKQERLEAL